MSISYKDKLDWKVIHFIEYVCTEYEDKYGYKFDCILVKVNNGENLYKTIYNTKKNLYTELLNIDSFIEKYGFVYVLCFNVLYCGLPHKEILEITKKISNKLNLTYTLKASAIDRYIWFH